MPVQANQMDDLNNITPSIEKQTVMKFADILKKSKGSIRISFNENPGLSISLGSKGVRLDVQVPCIFDSIELDGNSKPSGYFDKLRKAQKFAEVLNDCGLSIIVLRKGKEAFTIGRNAAPTLSSVLTGSDDIHIDSLVQAAKLGKDLSKSNKKIKRRDISW